MKSALFVLLALGLVGCATSIPADSPRLPLVQDVLVPMLGHVGLVNQHCTHQPDGSCKWDLVEYDLNSSDVRDELRSLKMTCMIGDEVYLPDQARPGLSRQTYTAPSCFLFFCGAPTLATDDYIPISDTQRLIDGRTVCYSYPQYGIGETFGGAE